MTSPAISTVRCGGQSRGKASVIREMGRAALSIAGHQWKPGDGSNYRSLGRLEDGHVLRGCYESAQTDDQRRLVPARSMPNPMTRKAILAAS